MKHYCDTISVPLAEKLKEKGMPMNLWEGVGKYMEQLEDTVEMRDGFYLGIFKHTILYQLPTYAEVFDWLMSEKGIIIEIRLTMTRFAKVESVMKCGTRLYGWKSSNTNEELAWHEAAEKTIEEAIKLI